MNTFLFACLCWRKKLTLEKQVNFYKPHAVFKLIYTDDMQVALALKAHAIWLVFENISFWFIPNCTRNAWLPIQIASKTIYQISSWMN